MSTPRSIEADALYCLVDYLINKRHRAQASILQSEQADKEYMLE